MKGIKITGRTYRHSVLRAEMAKTGRTISALERVFCCSRGTARTRIRVPESMAVGELRSLANAWNWTDEQIARFVRNE